MHGWKENFLSQAGKKVLLKVVVQAIPTYTMSVFQLPRTLCRAINAMMSQFWWGHKENGKKIAWMNWGKMGRSKDIRGLGYCDLECFNLALLAKQGWRLSQNPNSLVVQTFKEKYNRDCPFMEALLGRNPSYAWRSIWNAKPLLGERMVWRVGDGRSIHVWGDKWLPMKVTHEVQSPIRILEEDAKVSALIDEDTKWWNVPLVEAIFDAEEANAICGLPFCPSTQPNKLVWGSAKNGQFSVKSAYHVAMETGRRYAGSSSSEGSLRGLWRRIWHISSPMVVKLFMWQSCKDILPTNENLLKRKVLTEVLCLICQSDIESVSHALWSCPVAQDVWHECSSRIQKTPLEHIRFLDIFEGLLQRFDETEVDFFASVARQVWLRRNTWVFEGKFSSPVQVLQHAMEQFEASTQAMILFRQHVQPAHMASCPRP
jgi:hypothetical protein